ncbi:hypothetical protein SAMN05444354_125117 [Stigmatella aurantiaca]|uniref:Uncharacterized protein n=1 Tax=Stigmatella aurantiaca TaxID=41 RepID=A0A1H8C7N6_STIAU|nr:hypothetical protein [Stigmatella aurantiaca]SEM91050.1 hypothetical protein SAMN05444354_125117 [Stigmatella aurantiaca]
MTAEIVIPEGWSRANEFKQDIQPLLDKTLLCGGRVRATWEEYTNPNNDFTVPRVITLVGVEAASVTLILLLPERFPNMTRVANWRPTNVTKNVSLAKGQTHVERIIDAWYLNGCNIGYRCN